MYLSSLTNDQRKLQTPNTIIKFLNPRIKNIDLNKTVFNKRDYEKTIDSSFTQLGVKSIQEQINEQPTIQKFFDMYNELFYDIPEMGELNSHEFLIKTSGEYIDSEIDNEVIQALQNEIAQLREELLQSQQNLIDITNQQTDNS